MQYLLRPYIAGFATLLALTPLARGAQITPIVQVMEQPSPLLQRAAASQGYLGVDLSDVDNEKVQVLKLKEARGAVITLIDHDAPAGQIGLKVNDVVLSLNGQQVEGAEQLRRMLREIPAGHKVSLVISRDGNVQTLGVQLADRRAMEHDVWNKLGSDTNLFPATPGMGMMAGNGNGDAPVGGGFHMPFFGSSFHVGAIVEPLTSQMAEYLGVSGGLMIREVARKSIAENAGLKAFDVILRVGADNISTIADWDRALRSNQGKSTQVTILRDKKQQSVTIQVDAKKRGAMEYFSFPDGKQIQMQVAMVDSQEMADMQKRMEEFQKNFKVEDFKLSQKQADAIRKNAEKMSKEIKAEDFQLSQQQIDAIQKNAEEMRKNFKAEDFQFDQKKLDEMQKQMEKFRKDFKPEDFQFEFGHDLI